MELRTWFLSILHAAVTFVLSLGSYWSSIASKFQFQNVTKGLDWLPAGYYTLPVADEIYFSGMKAPIHLGLLVLEDTYCLAAIALVVSLTYSLGTKHFSIYCKGLSTDDCLNLEKRIAQMISSRSGGKANVTVRHILSQQGSLPDNATADDLSVHVVNPGDGKRMLVDVTKRIAELIEKGALSMSDVTPEYVDKVLQSRVQCPDPDLALKFGPTPSTCGYLPWQMRLTEVISLPSLQSFTPPRLKKALMSFSKIEQRLGK